MDAALQNAAVLRKQRDELLDSYTTRRHFHDALERKLQAPKGMIGADLHPSLGDDKRNAEEGNKWLSRMIGDGRISQPPVITRTPNSRSYFLNETNSVHMSYGAGSSTVVHELGHWVERRRPDIFEASKAFLHQRWETSSGANKQVQKLSVLEGSAGYAPTEVAFRDKFGTAYSGKLYTVGGQIVASEVVSMGFEKMYKNPVRFRDNEKEYYHFTLAVMQQVARNKPPSIPRRHTTTELAKEGEKVAYGG